MLVKEQVIEQINNLPQEFTLQEVIEKLLNIDEIEINQNSDKITNVLQFPKLSLGKDLEYSREELYEGRLSS